MYLGPVTLLECRLIRIYRLPRFALLDSCLMSHIFTEQSTYHPSLPVQLHNDTHPTYAVCGQDGVPARIIPACYEHTNTLLFVLLPLYCLVQSGLYRDSEGVTHRLPLCYCTLLSKQLQHSTADLLFCCTYTPQVLLAPDD